MSVSKHTKRYAARLGWKGLVEVGSAEFIQRPKSWRAVSRTGLAFDCKMQFNGTDPPGYASPREAVEAWIERQEESIAAYQARIGRVTREVAQAKEEHAELLSASKETE